MVKAKQSGPLSISIEVDLKDLKKRMERMGKEFKDWKPEMEKSGEYLQKIYSGSVFNTQGGAIGFKWPALHPEYEVQKRADYPGRNILERTGAMRKGFEFEATGDKMRLYNEVEYLKYHQYGRGVPQRPVMHLNSEIVDEIRDIFKQGIKERLQ